MTILEEIVAHKLLEVEERKLKVSRKELEEKILIQTNHASLKSSLKESHLPEIIAEFKRKSPSKGTINGSVSVQEVSKGYVQAGAVALSVLTDNKFFGGSDNDLINARETCPCPILRKEFIIDKYQILEARAMGANIVLLIAAILDKNQINELSSFAKSLNLEVLMEVHTRDEIKKASQNIDFIGVNNRNLKTFKVDTNNSIELANFIPDPFIKISESGLYSAEVIKTLFNVGYKAFLIGETFMKTENPSMACAQLIKEIKQ